MTETLQLTADDLLKVLQASAKTGKFPELVSNGRSYEASPIKRRRATAAEMELRKQALYRIVEAGQPMTVRQVFYRATVEDLVEKTEAGYAKVQRTLVEMRRARELPWGWITDNIRYQRKPRTFSDPRHALRHTAAFYRKALWDDADHYVEVWLERTR